MNSNPGIFSEYIKTGRNNSPIFYMKFKIIHVATEFVTNALSRYIQVGMYDNSLRRSTGLNIFVHIRKGQ